MSLDPTIEMFLWFFIIYSFLGWCVEVAYHAVTLGKVINRGFLNGPVCPVYGFGMLAVLAVFGHIETETGGSSDLALFFGGMALATSIELIAGWALDVLFHARWWDYSKEPFNFRGYICVKFSIAWGLCIVFVYRIIHSTVLTVTTFLLGIALGGLLLAVLYLVYGVDVGVTVATVRGLNKNLAELDDLRKKLRIVSDGLSEQIGEGTIHTAQKLSETKTQAAHATAELRNEMEVKKKQAEEEQKRKKEEFSARFEAVRQKMLSNPVFGAARLLKAFPDAVHREHDDMMKELRQKL